MYKTSICKKHTKNNIYDKILKEKSFKDKKNKLIN